MNRALVVGVRSTTFGDGAFSDLPGVDEDTLQMTKWLAGRGFAVVEISTPATTSAGDVASKLADFVDETRADDLGVIYLAGHGYRVSDTSGDEGDGWDESFVCSDRPILDDWFRTELWPRARPGARFVVVVDACHSASMTLALSREPPVPGPILNARRDVFRLVLSSCRDEETTRDRARQDAGGGVVTTQLLEAMRGDPVLSYHNLWARVATLVRDRYPDVGVPQFSYLGRDDSLLHAKAFADA